MKTKLFKYFTYVLLLFASTNCTSSYSDEDEYQEYDGKYCAEVTYYNPNTGTRSTYQLQVEVTYNTLQTIYWSNGGWLDDDHFYPTDLDEDGYCEFTSDNGYEYTVQIIGVNCTSTNVSAYISDRQQDERKTTCSRCGEKKSTYEDYCDDCTDAYCNNCGGFDDYKYSSYDICSDCKEKSARKQKTCQACGQYDRYMYRSDDYCSDCTKRKS